MRDFCLVRCINTRRAYVFPRHQLRIVSRYREQNIEILYEA